MGRRGNGVGVVVAARQGVGAVVVAERIRGETIGAHFAAVAVVVRVAAAGAVWIVSTNGGCVVVASGGCAGAILVTRGVVGVSGAAQLTAIAGESFWTSALAGVVDPVDVRAWDVVAADGRHRARVSTVRVAVVAPVALVAALPLEVWFAFALAFSWLC